MTNQTLPQDFPDDLDPEFEFITSEFDSVTPDVLADVATINDLQAALQEIHLMVGITSGKIANHFFPQQSFWESLTEDQRIALLAKYVACERVEAASRAVTLCAELDSERYIERLEEKNEPDPF